MIKNLFRASMWGIITLSLFTSCRTEDGGVTQKQIEDKRFAVFVSKNEKPVNYANGFEFLIKRYDEIKKTNISGINNPIKNNLNASSDKGSFLFQNKGSYVEFKVRSQIITEENGEKWMIFPRVENNQVIGLIMSTLKEKETLIAFDEIKSNSAYYKQVLPLFQEAFNRYNRKSSLVLNASINPMAIGGEGAEPGGGGSGKDCGDDVQKCGNIEEVIVPGKPKDPVTPPTVPIGVSSCWDIANCPVDPGSEGGGGGGGSPTWSNNILLFSKKPAGEKITNIRDYLKCLDLSQGATVTLYVDQPTPNTTSTWSGPVTDPNVGHTFISITQGGTTRFMGFYPSTSISPFSNPPAATGMYVNDQGHKYNVSVTSNITANQLNNMIGYINSISSATYNLNTYNYTNFGIDAVARAGISIPKTSGSWPGGGGANPGNLGQDLRNLNNSSVQKNTSGGNAPKNSGSCN